MISKGLLISHGIEIVICGTSEIIVATERFVVYCGETVWYVYENGM